MPTRSADTIPRTHTIALVAASAGGAAPPAPAAARPASPHERASMIARAGAPASSIFLRRRFPARRRRRGGQDLLGRFGQPGCRGAIADRLAQLCDTDFDHYLDVANAG